MSKKKTVLLIVGSFRKNSFNCTGRSMGNRNIELD